MNAHLKNLFLFLVLLVVSGVIPTALALTLYELWNSVPGGISPQKLALTYFLAAITSTLFTMLMLMLYSVARGSQEFLRNW